MIIDLIFSQANMSYYYYENGVGYTYEQYKKQILNGDDTIAGGSGSSFFFDDGGAHIQGYTESNSASWVSSTSSSSESGGSSGGGSGGNSGGGSGSSSGLSASTKIDDSALRGEYYGYG
jgi:hypothetical protein